jgi:CheY-like chemotaxis protein
MAATPTVLIVDDYADALDVWELYLRAAGFEVTTAATGPQALERATIELPDLVVMDLELPGLSGYEVAQKLRASAKTRHIPLIAATGYSHGEQLNQARKSGFDAIIIKPCDPDALVVEIRRLLLSSSARPAASTEQ